jgi:endonuclease/exonuclease/phosphatase family metal-dependent hydrolase
MLNLKIATWNVERPHVKGWKKSKNNSIINQKIKEINADIWILTETHQVINPGSEYEQISTDSHNNGENRVTIYSRYPLGKKLEITDSYNTICTEIKINQGSLIVYGTIIAYHGRGVWEGTFKTWEKHYQDIQLQGAEWFNLSKLNLPLCVAGDFNETLTNKKWYGTKNGRQMLEDQLLKSNLDCLTKDYRIDHICVSKNFIKEFKVNYWEAPLNEDHKPVSDHQGYIVDLLLDI